MYQFENGEYANAAEEESIEEILCDIEDILIYEGEGEDTSVSMSLGDIADEMEMPAETIYEALYAYGDLDNRFQYENGLYSRC